MKRAYASALSKLSLNTDVTARSISKLSVANVRTFCAAFVAAPAVVACVFPVADVREGPCVLKDDGDVARDAGRDREDGPASPGPYVYGADVRPRVRPESFLVVCSGSAPPTAALELDAACAQRCGRHNMNCRTRALAGSGSALPVYLDTTSTTCRIVSTTSRLIFVSVRRCSSESGALLTERDVEGEEGFCSDAMKSRKTRICASMCTVAYCNI
jgi:hypothetical protein